MVASSISIHQECHVLPLTCHDGPWLAPLPSSPEEGKALACGAVYLSMCRASHSSSSLLLQNFRQDLAERSSDADPTHHCVPTRHLSDAFSEPLCFAAGLFLPAVPVSGQVLVLPPALASGVVGLFSLSCVAVLLSLHACENLPREADAETGWSRSFLVCHVC